MLEDTDGLLRPPLSPATKSATSRCSSLLLSIPADVRSSDDVILIQATNKDVLLTILDKYVMRAFITRILCRVGAPTRARGTYAV